MNIFERARLFGQAAWVLDDTLGPEQRERVMRHFATVAAEQRQGRWKHPWDLIDACLRQEHIDAKSRQACRIIFLCRTGHREELGHWRQLDGEAVELIRQWGLFRELPGA
ncbi:MAG: hypothetical protein IMX01_08170 [Limnochordaceae bacterium]|nr:hypothetical protein [Limnochordaceae bacterium]